MNRFMNGWVNGFIGVAIFAGSLPATRVAVMGFEPGFLTAARAAIAGTLGLILILVLKQKKPAKQDWWPLAIVSLGVVIGFPLFTALALQYMNAAHSIVFVSLLPLATAIFAVLRGGEKPNQIVFMGDSVTHLSAEMIQPFESVSCLSIEKDLLDTDTLFQVKVLDYEQFADLVLTFNRCISLK